ncbi:hypothetical protein [Candidatus Nitrosotenuis uzonensis]|uniref:Uncharacterized protein n=1 Tax=Candidatus Nitrosotenuis uzonensis TaxID=1407055 RepID=V6ATM9_9ARCH|nr:hypothetical protein [Candidatus Nitrosotenuis uzonensis]CDI06071.1 hypothetical protein NITUZ_40237 [Candidatus Nitrosotenuis uzonensis]
MRCENCGELLKESKFEMLGKQEDYGMDSKKMISWTCDNCGQVCNKTIRA